MNNALFLQDPSSETAESKGSAGFFSQMFSELTAPLYEEDEQDFLSEDGEPENPSVEDGTGDDHPEDVIHQTSNREDDKPKFTLPEFAKSISENVDSAQTAEQETYFGGASESNADEEKGEDQKLPSANKEGNVSESLPHPSTLDYPSEEDETGDHHPEDAIHQTSNREDDQPKFTLSKFTKSITENVNSAQTAEQETYFGGASESNADEEKGEDQQLPNANKEGNVSESLPHPSTLDSANAENKKPELPEEQTSGRVADSAANKKSELSVEQTDDIEIDSQQEKEQLNSNKMQFEPDSTVNSANAEGLKTKPLVKEETAKKKAEKESANVNRESQDPEQEMPRSVDSSAGMQFGNKQLHDKDGATELLDEALESLQVKSEPQEQVHSDALEEQEQDLRKNIKVEAEEQESKERIQEQERYDLRNAEDRKLQEEEEYIRKRRLEKKRRDAAEKMKSVDEEIRKVFLDNAEKIAALKERRKEEEARKVRLEKEKKAAEEEKQQKEEEAKQQEEEEARQLRLESLKKQRQQIEEAEKMKMKKLIREAQEEEAKQQKEREAKQQKEEEARQLRLGSLKKEQQQIEETEKMEMKRLIREAQKEIPLKKLSGMERKDAEINDRVPHDEGVNQGKENAAQENRENSKDVADEEHMKIKGAFDRKIAEEEAALKKKLEMLSEERRNFEKMAEQYRLSQKERQQKEQKEKVSTKHSELSKAVTVVSPGSSKQVKTTHDQGWYIYVTFCSNSGTIRVLIERWPPATKPATLIFQLPTFLEIQYHMHKL